MKTRAWFRFENAADAKSADLYIFDIIGDWIDDLWGFDGVTTAKSFLAELAKLPDTVDTIRVHLNSPGGDVFSAVTIANTLRQHKATIEMSIEGLAASAATIVAMAGKTIRIGDNALMMIHNPWTIGIGESKDLRKTADELDKVRASIVATYRWHSELSDEALVALMDATTWMDADEAIANGFATEKVEGLRAAAALEPRALAKLRVPEKYRARVDALAESPKPAATAAEVLALVESAGLGTGFARQLLEAGLPLDEVTTRVTAAKDAKAKAEARANDIRAVCDLAKQPELAEGYIRGAMAVADVKAHLAIITARQDKAEIDAGLNPGQHLGAEAEASWSKAIAKVQGTRKGA